MGPLDRASEIADEYATLKYNPKKHLEFEVAHLHSEVSEVYKAVTRNEGRAKELEEMSDIFLNMLVIARHRGISYEELVEGAKSKAVILQDRIANLKMSVAANASEVESDE